MFQYKKCFLNYIINSLKVCLVYGMNFSRRIIKRGSLWYVCTVGCAFVAWGAGLRHGAQPRRL